MKANYTDQILTKHLVAQQRLKAKLHKTDADQRELRRLKSCIGQRRCTLGLTDLERPVVPVYEPTEEEIAAATERIRNGWSDAARANRRVSKTERVETAQIFSHRVGPNAIVYTG